MKKFSKQQKYAKGTILPITVNGAPATINTSTIPQKEWKSCHGEFAGVKVDSLQVAFRGDMAIIKRSDGFEASYDAHELGALAVQFSDLYKAAQA